MSGDLLTRLEESAAFLRERAGCAPHVGVVLGSGWDAFGDVVGGDCAIRYDDIPHFPLPAVHAGVLRVGPVAGHHVACLHGRCHGYEGYSPEEVAHAVLFMATREAAYITGTTLEVAGGL